MKIVVTGTAGFIGFHVAKFLCEKGHDVIGIDNFNSYYNVKLKEDRNRILIKYPNFKIEKFDLCDYRRLEEIFKNNTIDRVCHLAAQAGVRWSIDHPHDYISANIIAFLNILEGCRHYSIKRLVYASSSSVYGGNTKVPFSEVDSVDNPVSLYAATKKADELMAHCYTHLYGVPTVGLRFFTVYGPWGRPDMAMWLFTEAILKGKPIQVFNDGDMQRDFTYIDDIVQGVVSSLITDGLENYEIFNLGNHNTENLVDMIATLERALGRTAQKELLPMQPGDVKATYADIDKARKKLGFVPQTRIEQGIPQFVKWYTKYFNI